jgi:hypothetical protein
MRSRDPETRYREKLRHEQRALEEFTAHEIEWADDLLLWYKLRREEIPDDEYRAVLFFKNREYVSKPGSLAFCYTMYQRLMDELPLPVKETAFYLVAYRFKVYAEALKQGGFLEMPFAKKLKGGWDGGTYWG